MYEVFRILFPGEYQGTHLGHMQEKVDDLAHSHFLVPARGYLSPIGDMSELIDRMKDRDVTISQLVYLIVGLGTLLLCETFFLTVVYGPGLCKRLSLLVPCKAKSVISTDELKTV